MTSATTPPTGPLSVSERLLHHAADIAPTTIGGIAKSAKYYLDFAARHELSTDLRDIDPIDLAAFVYEKLFVGSVRIKPKTASEYVYGVARSWQGRTGSDEQIDHIARQVIRTARRELPQQPRRPAVVLPLWLMLEMLAAMRTDLPGYETSGSGRRLGAWRAARDRALMATLFSGALRPEECLEARIGALTRRDGGWELAIPRSKTNPRGERTEYVFLADDDLLGTGRLITAWLEVRGELAGDGLFPGEPDGIPISSVRASIRIRAAAERCGHTDNAVSLYSFRRTRATLALIHGTAPDSISAWLRHSSLATTSRYLDSLSHLVDDEDIAEFYRSRRRPVGADANRLGRGAPKPTGPIAAGTTFPAGATTSIDELRDLAVEAAQRGCHSYANTTLAEMRRIAGTWAEFCRLHTMDPAEPTAEHLAAWVVASRNGGQATGDSLRRYLQALEGALLIVEPTCSPATGKAFRVIDAYRRQDAADDERRDRQAPVHRRERFLTLAEDLEEHVGNTRDLDLAILRWHTARAESRALRGNLPRAAVTLGSSGAWVELVLGSRIIRLHRQRSPLACPVRAVERLMDSTAGENLVERWKINGGRLHSHGLHTRVEAWTGVEFRLATWVLGTGIRRVLRARLLVSVAWAGALRMADLREACIEELDPHRHGYLLHLGRSKTNQRNEPEAILLKRTGDALCPESAIDAWREVWPADTGPLLAYRIDHLTMDADGTELAATTNTPATVLIFLVRVGGIALTGHSFRRSRATHDWHEHHDLHRVRRLLRHEDLRWTVRYIEELDPLAKDITVGLVAKDRARLIQAGQVNR